MLTNVISLFVCLRVCLILLGGGRRRFLALRLLGQEHGLDVGEDAALGQRDARQQLVELLVVPDGELEVTRDDARLLVVPRRVPGQLEHFGHEVLHHGGQVDGRAGADAFGVVALAQQTVDAADGELKAGARRSRLGLSLRLAAFSASRHFLVRWIVRLNTCCVPMNEVEATDELSALSGAFYPLRSDSTRDSEVDDGPT